jgi:hypothetical protein
MGVRADGLEDCQARFKLELERTEISVTTSKIVCKRFQLGQTPGYLLLLESVARGSRCSLATTSRANVLIYRDITIRETDRRND